jgi:predicted nucleic acid-binding protein
MRYLLDVNALVALVFFCSMSSMGKIASWVRKLSQKSVPDLVTCSITELGFVGVLVQASQYAFTAAQARNLLLQLESVNAAKFTFITDDQDISQLSGWVQSARQTTDGHLVQLARSKGVLLATLDTGIPGAYLISVPKN